MGKCKNCGESKDLYENGLCEICEAERLCELVDKADYDRFIPL